MEMCTTRKIKQDGAVRFRTALFWRDGGVGKAMCGCNALVALSPPLLSPLSARTISKRDLFYGVNSCVCLKEISVRDCPRGFFVLAAKRFGPELSGLGRDNSGPLRFLLESLVRGFCISTSKLHFCTSTSNLHIGQGRCGLSFSDI